MKRVKFSFWPHIPNIRIASFRLRCLQIVEFLQLDGVDVRLFHQDQIPDVLVLSKRYDQTSIKVARSLKANYQTKIILDLSDNHFYSDSNNSVWHHRAELLRCAISIVDHVVCCSDELAEVVQAEAKKYIPVTVIGDASEPPALKPTRFERICHPYAEVSLMALSKKIELAGVKNGRKLVWFGNHGGGNAAGGMDDLLMIKNELIAHNKSAPIFLTIISNNHKKYKRLMAEHGVPNAYITWHPNTFSRALQLHDIALIPVSKNSFTICKTNNRLATSILHNLAVVATEIPAYREFQDCACLDDWKGGLAELMANNELRNSQNKKARSIINQRYSLLVIAQKWNEVLNMVHDKND